MTAKKKSETRARRASAIPDAALLFLEYYYPIHYQAGIGVEDALRGGLLNRHQVAMLWLIHSEGREGREMNRKAIERSLESWFEISGAAITKALRAMVSALAVNQHVTKISLPEASPLLPLRTRRYLNTLGMLLEKLVHANSVGASVARKRALRRQALQRFKARRRAGRRKG